MTRIRFAELQLANPNPATTKYRESPGEKRDRKRNQTNFLREPAHRFHSSPAQDGWGGPAAMKKPSPAHLQRWPHPGFATESGEYCPSSEAREDSHRSPC